MLALVSSMTTTVIGCVSLSKKVSGCGLSLSKTSKSSFVRFGTSRCSASVTVANNDTRFVPALKVGCLGRRDRRGGGDQNHARDRTPGRTGHHSHESSL